MAPRTLLCIILIGSLSGTCWAKHKKHPPAAEFTIEEISPASVTVDIGKDGHETYTITGTTKATLDGAPVSVDDLKAGMVTTFTLAADDKTVVTLAAKDPRRVTKKPVVHKDNVWVDVR